jgi:hypothetical protein
MQTNDLLRVSTARRRAWTLAAALAAGTAPAAAQVAMTDVTDGAGLGGTHFASATDHSLGINWIDFDDDGWPDLFLVGGNPMRDLRLFHNQGDGTFVDAGELLPPNFGVETSGSVFADFDRDGDLDVYVYTDNGTWDPEPANNPDGGPANLLLVNQWVENGRQVLAGQPLFVESAAAAGIDDLAAPPFAGGPAYRTKSAGWVDYDRDGCVDLYVGHWVMNEGGSAANKDRLYHSNCDGTFEDVTAAAGIDDGSDPTTFRAALAFLGAHLDGDLWPDLYVVNAGGGIEEQPYIDDLIYRNDGPAEGAVTFTEVSGQQPGIGDDAQAGMGIDAADVDRDGDWDLYISDLRSTMNDARPKGNVLYLGNGDGTFADNSAVESGVQGHNSWGVNFFDVDQDGWEDLYVATMNGTTPELAELLYINQGTDVDGLVTFVNVAVDIKMHTGNSRGSAVADYDRDGDLDLAVVDQGGPMVLFRNDTIGAGNWLQVKLRGTDSSRDGIGAVVEATVGGLVLMRQVEGGSSAHSQDDLVVHFGLGGASVVDQVRVRWPSGREDVLTAVAVDQRITVTEGQIFYDGFESGDFFGWSGVSP